MLCYVMLCYVMLRGFKVMIQNVHVQLLFCIRIFVASPQVHSMVFVHNNILFEIWT